MNQVVGLKCSWIIIIYWDKYTNDAKSLSNNVGNKKMLSESQLRQINDREKGDRPTSCFNQASRRR
jgi:hypothetical protein